MSVLYIMVPISLFLGLGFVIGFIWSVKSGQLDDTDTPQHRILED
ncbi:MAG: cbb3-type cytochrome oxidase assembly protein CcoS [Calothrix sp. SM1_5_4]|nr:cbb3-type cytochrome oxidase assembly protein CcoS [Calothrix sp. SM1_5_4]